MQQMRVQFDFDIAFTNGGGLQGQGFRLDIEGDDISDEELAAYIIRDLRLLMVGEVTIHNKEILAEPHKRSPPGKGELSQRVVDFRSDAVTVNALFAEASRGTVRVIAPDGESYLVRRAAE